VAGNFSKPCLSLSREASPDASTAAIRLPGDRFLPISSDPPAVLMDEVDGRLSAELACVSGWHPPELAGIRAAEPEAAIRFGAALPAGTRSIWSCASPPASAMPHPDTHGLRRRNDVALAEGLEKIGGLIVHR